MFKAAPLDGFKVHMPLKPVEEKFIKIAEKDKIWKIVLVALATIAIIATVAIFSPIAAIFTAIALGLSVPFLIIYINNLADKKAHQLENKSIELAPVIEKKSTEELVDICQKASDELFDFMKAGSESSLIESQNKSKIKDYRDQIEILEREGLAGEWINIAKGTLDLIDPKKDDQDELFAYVESALSNLRSK